MISTKILSKAMSIHSTAIIDSRAEIADGATVGPYAIIDGPVRIGAGVRIHAHAHISGATTIGKDCEIYSFTTVGLAPQDFHYDGAESYVEIGDKTIIREYVSVHRASEPREATTIGAGCMIMAKAHIGHDCKIGDGVVLTNGVECAGHVQIGADAVLSGNVLIHQFARIGRRVMCVGAARITHDVPPFLVAQCDGGIGRVNTIGLQREGFAKETIAEIRNAFRLLYRSSTPFEKAVEELRREERGAEVREILDFIAGSSKLGIAGPTRRRNRS